MGIKAITWGCGAEATWGNALSGSLPQRESKRCSAVSYPHPGLFPHVFWSQMSIICLWVACFVDYLLADVLDGIPLEK